MNNLIKIFIARIFGTTSAKGIFTVRDAQRIVNILIVTVLTGAGLDLSLNEMSHYTDLVSQQTQSSNTGEQVVGMIALSISEYMRRKITGEAQYEVVQPIRSRKRK